MAKPAYPTNLDFQKKKLALKRRFTDTVSKEGYMLYEPEMFEDYESFMKVNQRVKPSSMVKLTDNLGNILVLRPDVTTTIINQLIPRIRPVEVTRLFYDTEVYGQSPGGPLEKRSEFGVEYLGENGENADSNILNLMLELLDAYRLDYRIEIGNQRFLNALFEKLPVNEERLRALKEIITYKNDYRLRKFVEEESIGANERDLLSVLFTLEGDVDGIEDALRSVRLDSEMKAALNELRTLRNAIPGGTLKHRITFDLSMLSKYDYYQGITFQGFTPRAAGAVVKGGRYNPVNPSSGSRIPAIGFTLDIDALMKEVSGNE